jgi:pimeloyl-ACP methyl ester carboxylesterase
MTGATPLLLLPGSSCDDELFAGEVEQLSRDREVRVVDLGREDSIEAMAEAVLRDAPGTFLIAGLSLGGIVAMEVQHRAPERVESLALLDTNLAAPLDAQLEQRDEWRRAVAAGRFDDVVDALVPVSTFGRGDLDRVVSAMAHRVGPEVFERQNLALMHRPDRRGLLSSVEVPVLVVCGREDVVCPVALHEELAARAPQGSLTVIEGAGHLAPLDRPGAVAGHVRRWIAREHATVAC